MTYSSMDNRKNKPLLAGSPDKDGAAERRRLAKIVHDDRGNARVEWQDAPHALERVTLSIDGEPGLRTGGGYNPYERGAGGFAGPAHDPTVSARPQKRDLRKLSEWIKQMRELEARKQRGEDLEGDSEA